MNDNNSLLVVFSVAFTVVMVLMVLLPALARKQELLSFWSFFLFGAAVFTGLSGLNAARSGFPHAAVKSTDYLLYYAGAVTFFGAASLSYYLFKTPRRLAGKVWRKWPKLTPAWLAYAAILMLVLGGSRFMTIPIPFVSQLHTQLSFQAPIIALMLAMLAWWRNRSNLFFLLVFLVALAFMPLATIATGGGRRHLLSGLLCVPLLIYWIDLRYRTLSTRFFWILLAAGIGLPIMMGYSAIRHSSIGTEEAAFNRALRLVQKLPEAVMRGGSTEGLFGQSSVEVGISVINLTRKKSDVFEPGPFYSLYFMAVNPIPRSVWPEGFFGVSKPEEIGVVLPRNLGVYRGGGYVNWGINVVGQCYFDGGLHVHLLYGLMVGAVFRFLDELLLRKPGNPYVLAFFACSSSHVIAWTRGSIAGFSIQIFLAFLTVYILARLVRLLSGVGFIDPRTDHIDEPRHVDEVMRTLRSQGVQTAG